MRVAMAGLLLLTGCAASPDDAGDGAGDVRAIAVDIADGEITPPVGSVEVAEGDPCGWS